MIRRIVPATDLIFSTGDRVSQLLKREKPLYLGFGSPKIPNAISLPQMAALFP